MVLKFVCGDFGFNLNKQKHTAVREECAGKAKTYAKTHWEMFLQALGDHLSSIYLLLTTLWEKL